MLDLTQRALLRRMLPRRLLDVLRTWRRENARQRRAQLARLEPGRLREILSTTLGVRSGDTIFVHGAMAELAPALSPSEVVALLLDLVGPQGTVAAPTYPRLSSAEFLRSGEVFDQHASRSFTGALSEAIRRHPEARRSLHPTKSVAAIGAAADFLTQDHHLSPLPYGPRSPYARLAEVDGIILGLGVSSSFLSFIHAIEDCLGDRFPVRTHLPELFQGQCRDADGMAVVVPTYAHDLKQMAGVPMIPRFLRQHLDETVVTDIVIDGRPFFRVRARPAFERLTQLAQDGITWYPRRLYKDREK